MKYPIEIEFPHKMRNTVEFKEAWTEDSYGNLHASHDPHNYLVKIKETSEKTTYTLGKYTSGNSSPFPGDRH